MTDTPTLVPDRATLERLVTLREAVTGRLKDPFTLERMWKLEQEVHDCDPDPREPKYVRIAIEREHRLVQAVEIIGPLGLCKPLLGRAIRIAWKRWGAEAGDWEIMGLLPDPMMARIVRDYNPKVIQMQELRRGAIVFGVPLSHPMTKLSVPTFRQMFEEASTWPLPPLSAAHLAS